MSQKYKDKTWLREYYITRKHSSTDIAKICGCSSSTIRNWLKRHDIKIRTKSEARSGKLHHFWGKKRPNMAKRVSGKNNPMYGRKVSKETRDKLSQAGIGRKHTEETKEKIRQRFLGKPKSEEHKRKMSLAAKKRFSNIKNHPRYKNPHDRITPLYNQIRNCDLYSVWRMSVYKRDKFCCQKCGAKSAGNINADHIKPFAVIIYENNIISLEQARECMELWDVNNGRTLCEPCHAGTDTYAKKLKQLLKH